MVLKNKKGIFFTILVIVIISLFLLSYTLFTVFQDRNTIQKRIETMNNLIFSIEEDLERQIFTSGFRIIFLFEKRILEKGIYITDLNSTFEETFFNGTIYGEADADTVTLMTGAKFSDIRDSLQTRARKINVNVTMDSPVITIMQDDPWNVKITLTTEFEVKDKSNLALWNKTLTTIAFIPVTNFNDPIYSIGTNGIVINPINQTPYSDFGNINDLNDHATKSYYTNSSEAPNFLSRLEGQVGNSDPTGIESIVNLQSLSAQGISVLDKSVVDHIYFSGSNPSACNVLPSGMPSWFKLDNNHLATYEVTCT